LIVFIVKNPKQLLQILWNTPPSDLAWRIRQKLGHLSSHAEIGASRTVWCLSTGRVGSKTLAALSRLSPKVDGYHEPEPKLFGLSRCAYEYADISARVSVLKESVRTCRSERVSKAFKVYFESSPQVTFLAPMLQQVFENSYFIHVVRHPADVIRSGMSRHWYAGNPSDYGRIRPIAGQFFHDWERLSIFEKNVWLWSETNRWIQKFTATLPPGRTIRLKSEQIFENDPETIQQLYKILGVEQPAPHKVKKVLNQKLNRQRTFSFSGPADWSKAQWAVVLKHCAPLMEEYGYPVENTGALLR
jgi:hypothetical protein